MYFWQQMKIKRIREISWFLNTFWNYGSTWLNERL